MFASSPTAHVGVCGDSAGGYLAAVVACEFRNKLDFQVLIYPWLDLTCTSDTYKQFSEPYYHTSYKLAKDAAFDYLGGNIDPKQISPLYQTDFHNLAKTLILLAELDSFTDEGQKYFKQLNDSNVPCQIELIKGTMHGFFFNTRMTINAFKAGADHVVAFIKDN
jgi:acetyl esterase/lipase